MIPNVRTMVTSALVTGLLVSGAVSTAQAAGIGEDTTSVSAYCYRQVFSSTLTWGGDADTTDPGDHTLSVLLEEGATIREVLTDPSRPWYLRSQTSGVIGGGTWHVDAEFNGRQSICDVT